MDARPLSKREMAHAHRGAIYFGRVRERRFSA
jgi:hypothetical protein